MGVGKETAGQDVATNRLPAVSRKYHDNSTINPGNRARSQAVCRRTRTLDDLTNSQSLLEISRMYRRFAFIPLAMILAVVTCIVARST
jgi:hypothetical protein